MKKPTIHLVQLFFIQLLIFPRVTFQFLGIQLPFGQKPNLKSQIFKQQLATWNSKIEIQGAARVYLTICIGLSTFLCARNSLFTYSSPSRRMSGGSFRCARRRRLYRGIGGRSANGVGESPDLEAIVDGEAIKRRGETLIFQFFFFQTVLAHSFFDLSINISKKN